MTSAWIWLRVSQTAKWLFMTESITELLGESPLIAAPISLLTIGAGFEPHELIARPPQ